MPVSTILQRRDCQSIFFTVDQHFHAHIYRIVAATNFVFTGVSFLILDRVGKRRILLLTYPGIILGLALSSIASHFMTVSTGGQASYRVLPILNPIHIVS